VTATGWDIDETRHIDRSALLDHDILVNTVLTTRPVGPFLTHRDLDDPSRRLSVICDVTCDVTSDCNVLPIYERVTSWTDPVLRLRRGDRPLDLIAIDNLPSLLPKEASMAFSTDLTPLMSRFSESDPIWRRCRDVFDEACRSAGIVAEPADV
jgi:saccharopine dehydrogenase (NAD+, L-lysine-forming)